MKTHKIKFPQVHDIAGLRRDNMKQVISFYPMIIKEHGTISSHQVNANQSHNEIQFHIYRNGWNQKNQINVDKYAEKLKP